MGSNVRSQKQYKTKHQSFHIDRAMQTFLQSSNFFVKNKKELLVVLFLQNSICAKSSVSFNNLETGKLYDVVLEKPSLRAQFSSK